MLTALVQGEDDPAVLANLAQGTLRDKLEALAQALEGRVRPYHRVLIAQIMRHIRFLEEAIATLDGEIAQAAALLRRQCACCCPCLASRWSRPERSWPRSAWTWTASPRPRTWRAGGGLAGEP